MIPTFAGMTCSRSMICAERSRFPASPGGTKPEGRGTRGRMRKTNPICPPGHAGGAMAGPTMRNKPNFGRAVVESPHDSSIPSFQCRGAGWDERAKCAKRTQFQKERPTHEGTTMRNEAKLGRAGASGGRRVGKPIVRNKANSRQGRVGRGLAARGNCAKRTQFPAGPTRDGRQGQSYETKPLRPGRRAHGTVDCAKRTQFLRRGYGGQVLCGKGIMTNRPCKRPGKDEANFRADGDGTGPARGQLCETRRPRQKSPSRNPTCVSGPIPRIRSADPAFCRARQTKPMLLAAGPVWRSIVRNKANVRTNRRCRHRAQSCETKPISGTAM
jgi:hypothetical protein